MNLLVVIWSMITAACGMLGLIQIFLWTNSRREFVYLLSACMAFSASFVAFQEMRLFSTPDPGDYQQMLLWHNLAIAMVLVPMTWSIKAYLPTTRRWAAILITALWGVGLLVNFLMPGNLTFLEIQSTELKTTFWGDQFYVPIGTVNDWKWLADITVILIPVFIIDAAWHSRKSNRGKRGRVFTASVVLFMLFAGVHAGAVDAGLIQTPYMISVAFLLIVFALTWIFSRDAVHARKLAIEVSQAQYENERLMRVNLLGEVASALAHELNQPLAAILSNSQAAQKFLSRSEPDLDAIQDILSDIVRDDKRARDIILNMRQMLEGDESFQSQVNVESVIKWVLSFLESEFNAHDILVQLDVSGEVPDIGGSRLALQQVILNLLINAEHALMESGASDRVIRVQMREHNGGVEINVCDTGPGIAEDVLEHLFDPFVTTKTGNLGMGLAICQRIVESRGGRLTVENADLGGTCFRIWLPAEVV